MSRSATPLSAQRRAQLLRNYSIFEGGPGGDDLGASPEVIALGTSADLRQAYAESAAVLEEISRHWAVQHAGYKISMTNVEDQKGVAAAEPAYGMLTTAHLPTGTRRIRLDAANRPLVEPELVVRANRELTTELDCDELVAALDVPAASRSRSAGSPGGGPRTRPPPCRWATSSATTPSPGTSSTLRPGHPWPSSTSPRSRSSLSAPTGWHTTGPRRGCSATPSNAVRWLIEALARSGRSIAAGSLVSSGTLMPPLPAARGDFVATFSHDLGSVRATFE